MTCKTCGFQGGQSNFAPSGNCWKCDAAEQNRAAGKQTLDEQLAQMRAAEKLRQAEIAAKTRQSACYTTSGRYQAGQFARIENHILLTLQGSTWMRGDEEHDAGDHTSWYTPTADEQQHPEYQRLASLLAADLAAEEEATKRAQRTSENPEIRAYRAELDAPAPEVQTAEKTALKDLTGSDKQVKWANEIRRVAISNVMHQIAVERGARGQDYEDLNAFLHEPANRAANLLPAAAEASWWINNRANAQDLFRPYVEAQIRIVLLERKAAQKQEAPARCEKHDAALLISESGFSGCIFCLAEEQFPDAPTGSALIAAEPEVQTASVAKPSRFAPLPVGYAVAQQQDGRYVVIIRGQIATRILKSGEVKIRSYAHKSSARRFARKHAGVC